MKATTGSRSARLPAGALLALSALAFLAPARAAASCGTPRGPFHGDMSAPAAPDSLPTRQPPAPCTGPGCSASRFPLPLTSVPPAPRAHDPWGLPLAAETVSAPRPGPRPTDRPPACRQGVASSIYRPPR